MPPWKQALVGVVVLGVICAALAWRTRPDAREAVARAEDVHEVARAEAERIRAATEGVEPPRRRGGDKKSP